MHSEKGVIRKMHPHPLRFLGLYLGGLLLAVLGIFLLWPVIFVGILTFALGELLRRAETFFVTDRGVTEQYRLLSTRRKFAEYRRIQNIEVRQSVLENILDVGNVHFDTAGSDKTEVDFHGIKHPHRVERLVREQMVNSA
jgi:uncharacterized membrane protein YdbT with pleckstrin-like domain